MVYKILNPDYSSVYGAKWDIPDSLAKWVNLPAVKAPVTDRETISPVKDANRAKMERDYDNLYNEGAEGYNPLSQPMKTPPRPAKGGKERLWKRFTVALKSMVICSRWA